MYIAILLFEVIIPQGTVDNNLVSDRLTQKAQDLNHGRQLTL